MLESHKYLLALEASMSLGMILLLAVVQGFTEFLPISSSGHLLILADVCGQHLESIELTIALHLGSLLAICLYYHRRIARMLISERRTLGLVIVGTIPAVVIGLPLDRYGEWLLESPLLAACLLPFTAAILLWSKRVVQGSADYPQMSWGQAWRIGCWQALAILPGLSRSGLTIFAGLREGLSPAAAAAYSFLLAIPAISGAGVLAAAGAIRRGNLYFPAGPLALGVATSCLVGLVALAVLERTLKRGQLAGYALWCLAVSAAYLLWAVLART
jgi:undecaprenyl-diphosphatase